MSQQKFKHSHSVASLASGPDLRTTVTFSVSFMSFLRMPLPDLRAHGP
jgi:hypothetical protein